MSRLVRRSPTRVFRVGAAAGAGWEVGGTNALYGVFEGSDTATMASQSTFTVNQVTNRGGVSGGELLTSACVRSTPVVVNDVVNDVVYFEGNDLLAEHHLYMINLR